MKNHAAYLFNRRRFLKAGSLTTLTTRLDTSVIFAKRLPGHYLPLSFDRTEMPVARQADHGGAIDILLSLPPFVSQFELEIRPPAATQQGS